MPKKALADIEGLPMIVHVFKRASLSHCLDDVFVATDSKEIRDVVVKHGGKIIMTSDKHSTGSDRIAEAAKNIDADIIVNIQGDEALLDPDHIDKVVEPFFKDSDIQVAMLVTPFSKKNSPGDIKAVLDLNSNILYSSRTDLPSDARSEVENMWKVVFIVPYKKEFLLRYASLKPTPLEKIEYQEYLRILEYGYKIRAVPVEHA
ncbi:3-deoxy-manno-octulosonate cytidylyltransferase, partial [Candidatus Auribacterota bacterium]